MPFLNKKGFFEVLVGEGSNSLRYRHILHNARRLAELQGRDVYILPPKGWLPWTFELPVPGRPYRNRLSAFMRVTPEGELYGP